MTDPTTTPGNSDARTPTDKLLQQIANFHRSVHEQTAELDIYAQKILLCIGELELRSVTESIRRGTLIDVDERISDLKTAYDLYQRTIHTVRNLEKLFLELDAALLKRNHHKERVVLLRNIDRRIKQCLQDLPHIVDFADTLCE